MFDLKDLQVISGTEGAANDTDRKYSFVGIRRNPNSKHLQFCLPKGFEKFPREDYDQIKSLFFGTYKTYRKFHDTLKKKSEEGQFDGFTEYQMGYKIVASDADPITYSKLTVFDSILDSYNELQILTVKNKLSRSVNVDYSKIDRYLHKAIFLDGDYIYIDEMEFPKSIINEDSPPLIQMFCFIYSEIKQELNENIESVRVISLAHEFKESYLSPESALFSKDSFVETIEILRDLFSEIDRVTTYRDSDFWHFYEAVYSFLYGENDFVEDGDGNIWGLNNFSFLWEELCVAYVRKVMYEPILYLDRFGRPETNSSFFSPFYLRINQFNSTRKLRPDLVYIEVDETGNCIFKWPEDLSRIYNYEEPPVGQYKNLKIIGPKFDRNDFREIDRLYVNYLNRNEKFIRTRNYAFENVLSIHKDNFLQDVELIIKSKNIFDTSKDRGLINLRPCLLSFRIVDFKYISGISCCKEKLSDERLKDIQKQLVYEYSLQQNYQGSIVSSDFWIPEYFVDESIVFEKLNDTSYEFTEADIEVHRYNFLYLQNLYLEI